ncbi:MAG: His/Gly/Thr/Pro-type tRNA ligase C-terminal domain-containing protein, partial [Candidatus Paceibacteria bacterium]
LLDAESYGAFQTQVSHYLQTSQVSSKEISELLQELDQLFHTLHELGIQNAVFDFSLMRGFDYYTGLVFEVFDTHPDNRRALFGGGRYDNLLEIFNQPPQGAIGFGMGDVRLMDFLETHALLPEVSREIDVYMCVLDSAYMQQAYQYAQTLRNHGVRVLMDYSGKKLGAQLKQADAKQARYAVILGEQEIENNSVTVRTLATREQQIVSKEEAIQIIGGDYA